MKIFLLLVASVSAGALSFDHFHTFLLGLSVATLAVSSCYWFSFRTTRYPELALFLLLCGSFSKVIITVAGIAIGVYTSIITSPLVFAFSYLFFFLMVTYLWFSYKDKLIGTVKVSEESRDSEAALQSAH